jgi:hypothetical protein
MITGFMSEVQASVIGLAGSLINVIWIRENDLKFRVRRFQHPCYCCCSHRCQLRKKLETLTTQTPNVLDNIFNFLYLKAGSLNH